MALRHSITLFLLLTVIAISSCLREKHMVFYGHDIITGPKDKITSIAVAGVNGSSSTVGFGSIYVVDDVLTKGIDPSSPYVGRGKGIYDYADVNGVASHMAVTIHFENKRYNGSTLEFLGTDFFFQPTPSEVAVVGGTGKFRFARGYAIVRMVAVSGLNGIVQFNVTYRLH